MKRAIAVVAALTMVAGAFYLRDRGGSGGNGTDGPPPPAAQLSLACITELAEVCSTFAAANDDVVVTVEDAAVTEGKIARGASGYDGWLTLSPWPEIAGLPDRGTPLAQAKLGFAIWNDREAAIVSSATCPVVDWKCLGDVATRDWTAVGGDVSWGKVKVAYPPVTTATGLLLLGSAAAGYFGTAAFASNDFTADDGFRPWLTRLERYATTPDPLTELLQQGPSAYAAVGLTGAAAETVVLPTRSSVLDVRYPSPATTAEVVFAAVAGGTSASRLRALVATTAGDTAFAQAGWQPVKAGAPIDTGLPAAGVLIALRDQ